MDPSSPLRELSHSPEWPAHSLCASRPVDGTVLGEIDGSSEGENEDDSKPESGSLYQDDGTPSSADDASASIATEDCAHDSNGQKKVPSPDASSDNEPLIKDRERRQLLASRQTMGEDIPSPKIMGEDIQSKLTKLQDQFNEIKLHLQSAEEGIWALYSEIRKTYSSGGDANSSATNCVPPPTNDPTLKTIPPVIVKDRKSTSRKKKGQEYHSGPSGNDWSHGGVGLTATNNKIETSNTQADSSSSSPPVSKHHEEVTDRLATPSKFPPLVVPYSNSSDPLMGQSTSPATIAGNLHTGNISSKSLKSPFRRKMDLSYGEILFRDLSARLKLMCQSSRV